MERWREHVRLLGIFHWVYAALVGVVALLSVAYLAIGLFLLRGTESPSGAENVDEAFVAGMIGVLAISLTFTVLLALAGRYLQAHRHRTYCIVIAALACLSFPLGTALGVFTIVVLLKPEVQAAFEANQG